MKKLIPENIEVRGSRCSEKARVMHWTNQKGGFILTASADVYECG
ncbi:MAG: hypothetical protein SOI52_06500 [Erysipelotrichaceae bacterium]|jgi:hypothetical protein